MCLFQNKYCVVNVHCKKKSLNSSSLSSRAECLNMTCFNIASCIVKVVLNSYNEIIKMYHFVVCWFNMISNLLFNGLSGVLLIHLFMTKNKLLLEVKFFWYKYEASCSQNVTIPHLFLVHKHSVTQLMNTARGLSVKTRGEAAMERGHLDYKWLRVYRNNSGLWSGKRTLCWFK